MKVLRRFALNETQVDYLVVFTILGALTGGWIGAIMMVVFVFFCAFLGSFLDG
jgi:hypothetical protein